MCDGFVQDGEDPASVEVDQNEMRNGPLRWLLSHVRVKIPGALTWP